MKEEYYTPSIEEYHVGMEYEYKDYKGRWITSNDLTDLITDREEDTLLVLECAIDRGDIRVKRLSRECIEGEGFEFSHNHEPIPNKETNPVFEGYLLDRQSETGEGWFLYQFNDREVWIDYIKDNSGEGYVFKGKVKNKSELKRLLKMIGV